MLPLPTFPSHSAGYYMFIEASRPRVTGDKARLISPLYNITAKYYCVSFYYHMYGKHIGEYPPGKGKPSLMWAPGEDLQPPAPACDQQFQRVGVLLQYSKQQGGLLLSSTCPAAQQCQGYEAVTAHPWGSTLQPVCALERVKGLCGARELCGGHSYIGVGRMCAPPAVPGGCLLCLAPSSHSWKPRVQRAPQKRLLH